MRIAAAQTPEFREDTPAAMAYLAQVMGQAHNQGVSLLCFPEGFLQGYLTDTEIARRNALDLGSPQFVDLLSQLPDPAPMTVVGMIEADGADLYNTAVVIFGRCVVGRYRKQRLLRSERCFRAGEETPIFEIGGLRFGINICSDTNFAELALAVAQKGASLLVCPANNMLPHEAAVTWRDRHNEVRGERCCETGLWLMSADVTGARDDQVAWGPTAVLDPNGEVVAQLPLEAPGLLVFDLPTPAPSVDEPLATASL
ncbi:carbon-nitrogen hydrolase family protein [Phenylobacterium immobile]|uniref:carbon-nitrogen hydrolase family protein n=1 Tax=Phenylobacterium immobile TaxID=21 RepID=UPI000AEA237E|nr:carbon-nitrogen hydrolase family protein [Phenylobacterium immobile]